MDKIDFVLGLSKILMHWIGLFSWAYCFLLLMEVVVCKDVRMVNVERLLDLSLKRRYRIFLRNLKNLYYLGSVILLVSSLFILCQLSLELWNSSNIINKSVLKSVLSPMLSIGICLLYKSFGYKITYLQKLNQIFN